MNILNPPAASSPQHALIRIQPPLQSLVETDLVWQSIRDAAEKVALREPLLQQRLSRLVLNQATLAGSMAAVLASRLACVDMLEQELLALIKGLFEQDAVILQQTTADLEAVKARDPACPEYLHVLLNLKGFHALQTYRVANALWRRRREELAFALANQASLVFAVDIHPAARIGTGMMFDHGTGIVIGETTVIEDNVSILQNVTLGGTGKEHGDRHPKIRSGVMIGAGAKILGNIEIGTMSKVAAGSIVLKDVPPHCTVAGVPARVLRHHPEGSCPSAEMDQTI